MKKDEGGSSNSSPERGFDIVKVDVEASKALQVNTHLKALSEGIDYQSGRAAILRVTNYDLPLPPPDLLNKYEEECPGLRENIIDDWKAERVHRRALEASKVENAFKVDTARILNDRVRLWVALGLGLAGLLVICIVAMKGHTIPATALTVLQGFGAWAFYRRRQGPNSSEVGP